MMLAPANTNRMAPLSTRRRGIMFGSGAGMRESRVWTSHGRTVVEYAQGGEVRPVPDVEEEHLVIHDHQVEVVGAEARGAGVSFVEAAAGHSLALAHHFAMTSLSFLGRSSSSTPASSSRGNCSPSLTARTPAQPAATRCVARLHTYPGCRAAPKTSPGSGPSRTRPR